MSTQVLHGETERAARLFLWTALGAACGFIVLVLASPILQRSASRIFVYLLYAYDQPVIEWELLLLLPAIMLAPVLGRICRMADYCERYPRYTALAVAVILALGAKVIYCAHPLSMDEYAVWFQSRIFAEGELTGRFPVEWIDWLVPLPFQNKFLVVSQESGAVASAYWPGFALLMAPFSALNVAWLCNPVLAALSLLLTARLAQLIFPERNVAGWAMLLTMASSAFLMMGISFYAMTSLLLGNVAFLCTFWVKTPRRLFLAGLIGSMTLMLHNPLPHMLFAAPWVLSWWLQQPSWRQVGALFAGYLPLSLILGGGWWLLRGQLLTDSTLVAPGALLASVFSLPGLDVLGMRLAGAVKLWSWAVPGLLVLAGMGYCQHRARREVRLLAASAGLTLLAYLFVPFDQGHGWGYRYFYPAWVVLPILAAGALASSVGESRVAGGHWSLQSAAGTLVAMSLLVMVPLQLMQVATFVREQIAQLPPAEALSREQHTLVLIRPENGFYALDLIQNDPFLRGREWRMVSRGAALDAVLLGDPRLQGQLLKHTPIGDLRSRP